VIRSPLSTEKAMKKMEDENTMVFLADPRSNKKQIKEAFEAIY
jgi:large subunit ribosomal protein L23Ae